MAEQRLAMVVGIDQYGNFGPDAQLRRAVADAESIGKSLQKLGFSVTVMGQGTTVTQDLFLRKFAAFTQSIRPGDTVLFYFAGHGVGLNGVNYLVPADVPNLSDADQYMFRAHALAENDIRQRIQERGAAVTVLMLDACRNNPFRSSDRAVSYARGLEAIEPTNGVLTIYAAGYGQTALDRLSDNNDPNPNSVFTRVVLDELQKPGLNLIDFSEDVREKVATLARSVGHDQVPAVDNQLLGGRSVYLQGNAPPIVPPPAPQSQPDEIVWSYVKTSRDASALRRFMNDYPESRHKAEAEAQIAAVEVPPSSLPIPSAEPPDRTMSADESAWAEIASTSFSADLRGFLDRFPRSALRPRAEARLAALDESLWEHTQADDPAALRHYLALFGDGRHHQEAETWLTALDPPKPALPDLPEPVVEAPASPKEDDAEWARVATSTTPSDIMNFLVRFPQSALRSAAEDRLLALDEALWAKTATGDRTAIQAYLLSFPGGLYHKEATQRLSTLAVGSPEDAPHPSPQKAKASPAALPLPPPQKRVRLPPRVHERRQASATPSPPPPRKQQPKAKASSDPHGCFEVSGERYCP